MTRFLINLMFLTIMFVMTATAFAIDGIRGVIAVSFWAEAGTIAWLSIPAAQTMPVLLFATLGPIPIIIDAYNRMRMRSKTIEMPTLVEPWIP